MLFIQLCSFSMLFFLPLQTNPSQMITNMTHILLPMPRWQLHLKVMILFMLASTRIYLNIFCICNLYSVLFMNTVDKKNTFHGTIGSAICCILACRSLCFRHFLPSILVSAHHQFALSVFLPKKRSDRGVIRGKQSIVSSLLRSRNLVA